jgi:hypothetical protein
MRRVPDRRSQSNRRAATATLVAALVALIMLAVNLIGAQIACHTGDTATCAYSASKDGYYSGTFLATGTGRVVNANFGSLQDQHPVPLAVRPNGRFCMVWAHERTATATPSRTDRRPLTTTTPGAVPLGDWRPSASVGVPPGCQRSSIGIAWDRASDLTGSWQYLVLLAVPAIGLILALLGRFVPSKLRTLTLLASILALVASVGLSLVLW